MLYFSFRVFLKTPLNSVPEIGMGIEGLFMINFQNKVTCTVIQQQLSSRQQSTNQPTNQPTDQLTNQPTNHQPINFPTNASTTNALITHTYPNHLRRICIVFRENFEWSKRDLIQSWPTSWLRSYLFAVKLWLVGRKRPVLLILCCASLFYSLGCVKSISPRLILSEGYSITMGERISIVFVL